MIAALAALATVAQDVPARADSYTDYLAAQLRRDPVYISAYSSLAVPAEAGEIKRLVAPIPLRTYVVADVAAGPDGRLQDSDLAAVLHDRLGGGLFIVARGSGETATAAGFGTSLPVGDAMLAAVFDAGPQAGLAALVSRFVAILRSGRTEQRLTAAERRVERQTYHSGAPGWELLVAAASGAAVSGGLTVRLLIRRKRRRRRRSRLGQVTT